MSHSLIKLGISDIQKGLRSGEFSVTELIRAYIKRMEDTRALNTYITETPEHALTQAENSDARIKAGKAKALEGVPMAIKDMFCTKGIRTTAGSKMLENFVPPYESTVTERLWNEGAVLLGKTNQDAFAMGSSSMTSFFGAPRNPWDPERTTGGSGGGSAAVVVAGSALGALGTDTGGSVRQPAAFCGGVGLKPTYGRVPRWGIVAFGSSLDQAGVNARSVRDAAAILQVIAGFDPKEATCSQREIPVFAGKIGGSMKGMRIGIPREWAVEGAEPVIDQAWENSKAWLQDAGCEIVEVSLPLSVHALACYYMIAPSEAASNLARFDGVRYGHRAKASETLMDLYKNSRGEGFGWEVKRRIVTGTYVLSRESDEGYYAKALKLRRAIQKEFMDAFRDVSMIMAPTAPSVAFLLDEAPTDPVMMYLCDIWTVPMNIAGVPAISVPAGVCGKGLPVGMQLIAPHFCEDLLFQGGAVIEACAAMPPLPLDRTFPLIKQG